MNPEMNLQDYHTIFSPFRGKNAFDVFHAQENSAQTLFEPNETTAELVGDILALVPLERRKLPPLSCDDEGVI